MKKIVCSLLLLCVYVETAFASELGTKDNNTPPSTPMSLVRPAIPTTSPLINSVFKSFSEVDDGSSDATEDGSQSRRVMLSSEESDDSQKNDKKIILTFNEKTLSEGAENLAERLKDIDKSLVNIEKQNEEIINIIQDTNDKVSKPSEAIFDLVKAEIKENALKFTGTRVLPAAVGYMAAHKVDLYGGIAICALVSLPFVFGEKYKKTTPVLADVETVFNSLAFGVAAHKAIKFAPVAENRLVALYRR